MDSYVTIFARENELRKRNRLNPFPILMFIPLGRAFNSIQEEECSTDVVRNKFSDILKSKIVFIHISYHMLM